MFKPYVFTDALISIDWLVMIYIYWYAEDSCR